MIQLEDRKKIAQLIAEACDSGARQSKVCQEIGIHPRTLQRWLSGEGLTTGDRRPDISHFRPSHALTESERQIILATANETRFAEMPPSRIVPMLADEGIYIASESSFTRVLREHGQNKHRGRSKAPTRHKPPSTHIATGPNQVWCWDLTYLPSTVKGQWFYLYMILDLYSRKIVGWAVHEHDRDDHAAELVLHEADSEKIAFNQHKPILHGDNGSTLKATTVLAMLHWLGIHTSYSRPRVSNDNPYSEALFKTAKYRPEFPVDGFSDIEVAKTWARDFVDWYNTEHRHSGIRYVTPQQRHTGEDQAVLEHRRQVYNEAKKRCPKRWSGEIRNWSSIPSVALNPERQEVLFPTASMTNDGDRVA